MIASPFVHSFRYIPHSEKYDFNPYFPLWLKELGFGLVAISILTSVQAATRLFAPYGWGWLSDHTGERVKLLRYGASMALVCACLCLKKRSYSER